MIFIIVYSKGKSFFKSIHSNFLFFHCKEKNMFNLVRQKHSLLKTINRTINRILSKLIYVYLL